MARRMINPNVKAKPLIKTTIHEDLYKTIENFRRAHMKKTGMYMNNSMATQMLARKINRRKG